MDDNETERDEIISTEFEALKAIYGDEHILPFECNIGISNSDVIRLVVKVELLEPYNEIAIDILVSLPPSYPQTSPPQLQLLSKYIGKHGVDSVLFGHIIRTFISDNGGADFIPNEGSIFNGVEDVRERCTKWLDEKVANEAQSEAIREGERENRLASNPQAKAIEKKLEADAVNALYEQEIMESLPDGLEIITTPSVTYSKSTFAGHCVDITDPSQVPIILNHLLSNRKIAKATHPIINAWRCKTADGVQHQDNDDDGESAAGGRIAHLLQILDVNNVLVVVTRWYGGVHLGPDRFKYINQVARDSLELAGHLNEDTAASSKKQSNSRKSKQR